MTTKSKVKKESEWYLDSAATSHMSCNRLWFSEFQDMPSEVLLADDSITRATGIGTIILTMHLPTKKLNITLRRVLFVQTLKKNFLSVPKVTQSGCIIINTDTMLEIRLSSTEELLALAIFTRGLYVMQCSPVIPFIGIPAQPTAQALATSETPSSVMDLLHQRLGHIGIVRAIAQSSQLLSREELSQQLRFCTGCAQGKQHRLKIGRSSVPVQLITSDICGPFPTSLSGALYFSTFNDSHSRRTVVAFLKRKEQVLAKFRTFKSTVMKEIGLPI